MHIVGITCGVSDNQQEVCQLGRGYLNALGSVGLAGVIIPPQQLLPEEIPCLFLGLSGLIFSGGGDPHPMLFGEEPTMGLGSVDAARDEWEIALLLAAIKVGMPVLGICRGMQLINVALGGSLWQDLSAFEAVNEAVNDTKILHRQTAPINTAWHSVCLAGRLAEVFGCRRIGVNSMHHQGVKKPGSGLIPLAWAGDGLVEAIGTQNDYPLLGVQWHAEHLPSQKPLWQEFADWCRAYGG